ncbi:MAG: tetratricopeptide repeat protein [Candidatus Helarchaeota archaeon]
MEEKALEAYAVAVTAFQKGDTSKAIKFWKKVINNRAISEKIKGKAHLGLGFCYSRKEKLKDALNEYKNALRIFQKLNDRKAQAECLGIMGGLYFRNDLIKEALTAYESALYLAKSIKNREMEADILGDIGSVLDFMNKYEEAIDIFTRSLKLYRRMGKKGSTRGEARALYDLGYAYQHAGKINEGRSYLEKSLRLMKKNNDKKGEANCHVTLGDIYLDLDQTDNAWSHYKRALRYFQSNKSIFGIINVEMGFGKVFIKKGEFGKAKERFEKALELATSSKYTKLVSSALLYMAKIHEQLGDEKEAATCKAKAYKFLKDLGIKIDDS